MIYFIFELIKYLNHTKCEKLLEQVLVEDFLSLKYEKCLNVFPIS